MGIINSDGDGGGDLWRWLPGHFPVTAGCQNRDFLSPESPARWRQRYRGFRGFLLDALGFLGRRLLIGAGIKVALELCPRGNNKDVIIIILVHDKVYIPCYNCIKRKLLILVWFVNNTVSPVRLYGLAH